MISCLAALWGASGPALAVPPSVQVTEHRFAGGIRRVEQPVLDGLPVLGAPRVEAIGLDGRVRRVWGDRLPETSGNQRWPQRAIAGGDAEALAERAAAALGRGMPWRPRAERAWWWREGEAVPVWSVALSTAAPPATWRMLVDARDGRAVHLEQTSREARGRVYPTNPATSEPTVVELPRLRSEAALVGDWVITASCDAWTLSDSLFGTTSCDAASAHATPDSSGDYLFPPDPGSQRDPFAEVHVYWHVDRMSAWLLDCCGLTLPYAPIQANVNFPWANAFYGDFDGNGVPDVSFGQDEASGVDLGYDADVVYHELGHAVIGVLAPELGFVGGDEVGLQWAPGAVNEGAADVWSMLLAQDPALAEYGGGAFGRPSIRDLSYLRRCPDDLGGEVHLDGEILASVGWALIADPVVGPEVVTELLLGAVPLWGPDLDWPSVGTSFARTADDLLDASAIGPDTHARILEVLREANLEGCGRVVALDDGRTVEQYLLTGGLQGPLERLPGGVGLSLDVPEDAVSIRIDVSSFDAPPEMGFALYGRVGEPVGHTFTLIEAIGLGFATPAEYDWVIDGEGSGLIELPPTPGETLYLSLASRNLGGLVPFEFDFGKIALSASIQTLPEPPGPVPERGCGCGAPGARPGWGLLALAPWLRRRRA